MLASSVDLVSMDSKISFFFFCFVSERGSLIVI